MLALRVFHVLGMEYYVAESKEPLAACLDDVTNCNIYILILSNRYGYINAGQTPGQEYSITHQEYLKAKELGKQILVFKIADGDTRFPIDSDDPDQPSAAIKQAKLQDFIKEVRGKYLMHPNGFTSEYQLALQVTQSLIRHPEIEFDGALEEERKILCDRAPQTLTFNNLNRENRLFNIFLIEGGENDLGDSLANRLSKYYLSIPEPTIVSYYEFISNDYRYFRMLLLEELCLKLFSNSPNVPNEPVGILTELKTRGSKILTLVSSFTDDLQTQKGYKFLDQIMKEFSDAALLVGAVRVFWFIVIDTAATFQAEVKHESILQTEKLSPVGNRDFKNWIRENIDDDPANVIGIQKLCFSDTIDPAAQFDMYDAQSKIKKFIKRFNLRRTTANEPLIDIIP